MALTAVLVLGWVGVLIRDREVGEEARAGAFSSPGMSRVERDRSAERLRAAQLLNPDSSPELLRGSYFLLTGRPGRAAVIAEALVRSEPENIGAWGVLLEATRTSDPSRSARAEDEIRRLDPLGSHSIVPALRPVPERLPPANR